MSRKFIATIAAAAVALTTLGSAPVQAQERNYDLERTLAAILGIAIVGKVIHDKNKRDDRVERHAPRHVAPVPRQRHRQQVQQHRNKQVQQRHRQHIQPKPLPRRVNKRLLPSQCFRSFETRRGTARGFGLRCINNNFRFASSLPRHCLDRIRTDRGVRNIYRARCMRNAGYRLARG